jgi:hypothetical protein
MALGKEVPGPDVIVAVPPDNDDTPMLTAVLPASAN